jgi:hypothetical protein
LLDPKIFYTTFDSFFIPIIGWRRNLGSRIAEIGLGTSKIFRMRRPVNLIFFIALLLVSSSGTVIGSGDSLVQACLHAKQQAHQDRCHLLASDKTVAACYCNEQETDSWTCEVGYEDTCRSYAAFTPIYVQTATAKATSPYSRSLACAAAKTNAKPYKCRVDRFEKSRDDCFCETRHGLWTCLVDFKFWCY